MSHTNVGYEEDFILETYSQRISALEAELAYWKKKAAYYRDELANIPAALLEWGKVDFYDKKGSLTVTAVPKNDAQQEARRE